ncbi:MAG: sodium/proline symporter PutP [Lentisphaeria bacterium]|nr:sodium/proline symporter PutP [Lentisphaeria bacterium]
MGYLKSIGIEPGTLFAFVGYMIIMVVIGAVCSKKSGTLDDYLLGGRGVGSWVTAFSAQASDMSGWLLMGLPGAIFLGGMADAWVAIGLALGTLFNWLLVAPRLRVYTAKTNSLTLSTFFAERFQDKTGMLRVISALIILLFFTIYAASGMVAAGKLFNSMLHMNYQWAVVLGAAVVLLYTLMGGYLAVCWTDLMQGTLMFIAIIAVPLVTLHAVGGMEPVITEASTKGLHLFPGEGSSLTWLGIISCAVWGLGYFGQPHILSRFMRIKDVKLLPKSTSIAMTWVVISLFGACAVAFVAMPVFPHLPKEEAETVFIKLIGTFFNPWIGGILLAAIMAAIMSTIDSQLLVTTSALTEDFYLRVVRRNASIRESVWVSRGFVMVITIIAMLIALFPNDTIFNIVKFAWGGFGAAFGPVVLMALFSRKTTWQAALAGMITGTVVMLLWYFLGLSKYMYEILPGFVANFIAIFIVNAIVKQDNAEIVADFDRVKAELNGVSPVESGDIAAAPEEK